MGSFRFWSFCGTQERRRRLSRAPSDVPDDDQDGDEAQQVMQKDDGAKWKTWLPSSQNRPTARQASAASVSGNGSAIVPSPSACRPARSHRRTLSGGSDRKQLEIEQAYTRLALERADFEVNRKSFGEKTQNATADLHHDVETRPAHRRGKSKEWWDQEIESALASTDDEEHKGDGKAAQQ